MLFDSPLNAFNSIVKKHTCDTNSKIIRTENTIATLGVKLDTIYDSLHKLTILVNQLAEAGTKDNRYDEVIMFDD